MTVGTERLAWPNRRTIKSVFDQSYPRWEWIIIPATAAAEDAGPVPQHLQRDSRVRTLPDAIGRSRAESWNAAWREARGTFVALLDVDDVLPPSALYEMAAALEDAPDCDILYSDEDRIIEGRSRRGEPHFKPAWSPEYMLTRNYIGRLTMVRRDSASAVGGFRDGYDGAEEWDLLLRLSRHTSRIRRLPRCLYHRGASTSCAPHRRPAAAVEDHCRQLGLDVVVSGEQ